MEFFDSREAYIRTLRRRAVLPDGFLAATASLQFIPPEKPAPAGMNLSLILLEEESPDFGAVFTSNRFPGAPVLIGRQRMAESSLKALLVNNKIANAAAPSGMEGAQVVLERLGALLGVPGRKILPASTGIIGWRLPVKEIEEALPGLVEALQPDSILPVAEAIMTTDSYPKVREATLGQGRIVGVAKGAGMIEPNLATMLVFLLTDVEIDRDRLRSLLRDCAKASFNRISVDGDQSTSDTAVLVSSRRKPPVPPEEFYRALLSVCRALAEDIVRNGEGVGHVIRVRVENGGEMETALGAAKAVVNSPLVKTAVFGNDPNVGRIVSALGDYLGCLRLEADPAGVSVRLGGIEVFSEGEFRLTRDKEERLSGYLRECSLEPAGKEYPAHDRIVEITVDLGLGGEAAEVLGGDLSYEYIRENADYRS